VNEEHIAPGEPGGTRAEDRLDSWKKIASYLRRDVSTVQRWERREGLPVHRHLHDKQGSVFAFRTELDTWWEGRRSRLTAAGPALDSGVAPDAEVPAAEPERNRSSFPGSVRTWLGLAVLTGAAVAVLVWVRAPSPHPWRSPLEDAKFTRVGEFAGLQQAAAISGDGRMVAFLGEQDGHTDAWVSELASGHYRNLTRGQVPGLVNPSIRVLAFTRDAALVSMWTRDPDGSKPSDVNVMAVPVNGGTIVSYLPGVAEFDWSHEGKRLVYHTTAPGDPLFVRDAASGGAAATLIYTGPPGVHCHFPLWSLDDAYIYFVRGVPPDDWALWRIRPSGAQLERLTEERTRLSYPVLLDAHNLAYLSTDADGSGPWLYVMDLTERRSHRISSGLATFTSLAASADGAKLIATLSSARHSLWQMSLAAALHPADPQAAPVRVLSDAATPRLSADALVYTAASGDAEAIWVRRGPDAHEIYRSRRAHILNAPTISDDGQQIAFSTAEEGRTVLNVVRLDGSHFRRIEDSLALRGNCAWFADGLSLLCAVVREGEPRLTRIYLNGETPTLFVADYSTDPVWAPDHRFVVYSGADIGTTFPLRAAAADGRPYPISGVMLTRGARRMAFYPASESLLILDGDVGHKNFWLLDLATGARRPLAQLPADFDVRDFDVAVNQGQLVVDRVEAGSEMAAIDRTRN
jgi:hypothetical protein